MIELNKIHPKEWKLKSTVLQINTKNIIFLVRIEHQMLIHILKNQLSKNWKEGGTSTIKKIQ